MKLPDKFAAHVFWVTLILMLWLCAVAFGGVAEDVHRNTVVVTNGAGHGSGVLFTRGDRTFVWTAAHVGDIFARSDGTFREAIILQGDKTAFARVLRCGDYTVDTDCALLEITSGDGMVGDARFFRGFNHIKLGQEIVHCGTPLDISWNERLVTFGRISGVDKLLQGNILAAPRRLDHVDITGGPGCSGGPVVDEGTGGIVGLVVMGSGPSMMIIEPTRYIYEWCVRHDCLFAFDRTVDMPYELHVWLGDEYVRRCRGRDTTPPPDWSEPPPELAPVLDAIRSIGFWEWFAMIMRATS